MIRKHNQSVKIPNPSSMRDQIANSELFSKLRQRMLDEADDMPPCSRITQKGYQV